MPRGRQTEGQAALSNAERQARHRARKQARRRFRRGTISIWTSSPPFSRLVDMAVTERCATTSRHSMTPRASRGKSWVLAMLAPKRGLRVAPVPPKLADLTRPPRGRPDNGRPGRRNRHFDRTKEQSHGSSPCGHDQPSLTVAHPMGGETEQASHTEIRTVPWDRVTLRTQLTLPPSDSRSTGEVSAVSAVSRVFV